MKLFSLWQISVLPIKDTVVLPPFLTAGHNSKHFPEGEREIREKANGQNVMMDLTTFAFDFVNVSSVHNRDNFLRCETWLGLTTGSYTVGARLVSLRRAFQTWGTPMEKALSLVVPQIGPLLSWGYREGTPFLIEVSDTYKMIVL